MIPKTFLIPVLNRAVRDFAQSIHANAMTTNSIVQNLPSEVDSCSARQEISDILWNGERPLPCSQELKTGPCPEPV
jgi:hypothetical protein